MHFRFGSTVITVNTANKAALLATVAERLHARQGFALATINLDHLVKLRGSESFRLAYAAQDIVVADGHPIVWLSWLAGSPVSLVPGSDMVLPLARVAAESGVKVALVGANEETLAAAATRLRAVVPGLKISYCHAPSMGFDPDGAEAAEILRDLAQRDIGLCFLALGAPRQERLAARGRQLSPNVGFACFGAGLDFVTGAQNRAPAWMRRLALEWLWRALSSPRRMIPRYAACAAILPSEIFQAIRQR